MSEDIKSMLSDEELKEYESIDVMFMLNEQMIRSMKSHIDDLVRDFRDSGTDFDTFKIQIVKLKEKLIEHENKREALISRKRALKHTGLSRMGMNILLSDIEREKKNIQLVRKDDNNGK